MPSSIWTPWHLPKEVENLCLHKTYMQMFIDCKVLTIPMKGIMLLEVELERSQMYIANSRAMTKKQKRLKIRTDMKGEKRKSNKTLKTTKGRKRVKEKSNKRSTLVQAKE